MSLTYDWDVSVDNGCFLFKNVLSFKIFPFFQSVQCVNYAEKTSIQAFSVDLDVFFMIY